MKANPATITKGQFVALLRESGVSDAHMRAFHALFEQRHPAAHEAFLRHLQIEDAEVKRIRQNSR